MKKFLTGSSFASLIDELSDKENITEADENVIKVFEDLVNSVFEYETNRVLYTLKPPTGGFTKHWFVNQRTKMMECFPAKLEVELIEEYDEDSYVCYVGDCHIIVKKDMLLDKVMF